MGGWLVVGGGLLDRTGVWVACLIEMFACVCDVEKVNSEE